MGKSKRGAVWFSMTEKRVEPKKRWVGGRFGWAIHRFPIKGGISLAEILAENVTKDNTLLKLLTTKGKHL